MAYFNFESFGIRVDLICLLLSVNVELLYSKDCSICKETVERVKNFVDETQDKCADFYSYACNGWLKSRKMPEYLLIYDIIDELKDIYTEKLKKMIMDEKYDSEPARKLRPFLNSCLSMDKYQDQSFQTLKEYLDSICGWPSINPNWGLENGCTNGRFPCKSCKLEKVLIYFKKLFSITLVQFRDTAKGFFVSPGKVPVLTKASELSRDVANAIRSYREQLWKLAVNRMGIESPDFSQYEQSYNISTNLLKHSETGYSVLTYDQMNLSELNEMTGHMLNWTELLSHASLYNRTLDNSTIINVSNTNESKIFFVKLKEILTTTNASTIVNMLINDFVYFCSESLGTKFTEIMISIKMLLAIYFKIRRMTNPKELCFSTMEIYLYWSTLHFFSQHYIEPEYVDNVIGQYDIHKRTLIEMIAEWDLISSEQRESLINLINNATSSEGILKNIFNTSVYADNEQVSNLSHIFLKNVIAETKRPSSFKWSGLFEWMQRNMFRHFSFQDPPNNIKCYTPYLLHPPYYHPQYPKAMNEAGFGYEISLFDKFFEEFVTEEIKSRWLDDETLEIYFKSNKTLLLKVVRNPKERYSSKDVLGRFVGQYMALVVAYKLYANSADKDTNADILLELGFKGDQLFFLNFAQTMCTLEDAVFLDDRAYQMGYIPKRYNVNSLLRNMPEFLTAFGCSGATNLTKHVFRTYIVLLLCFFLH